MGEMAQMTQPARADHQQPDHQQHQVGSAVVAADLAAQRAANSLAQIEQLKIAPQQFQPAVGSGLLIAKLDGKLALDHPPQPRYRQPHPWGLSCRRELRRHALQSPRQRLLFFDQSSTTGRIFSLQG